MAKREKSLLIGFIGSPREDGNTAYIVRYALSLAKARKIRTREIQLSHLKAVLCGTRCNYECLRKQSCPVEDNVYEAYRAFAEADAIIVSTPAYGRRLPALMYAFLQRAQGLPFEWPLTNKPVAILFICDEKYDCQPGKRDLEEFFGWKSRVVTSITVGTPNIDPPPSPQNYQDVKKAVYKLLQEL